MNRRRIHGTASTYRHGCRCGLCRVAHRKYTRAYRDSKAAQLKDDPSVAKHGTDTTYNDYRCRCTPCRDAHMARLHANEERKLAKEAVAS